MEIAESCSRVVELSKYVIIISWNLEIDLASVFLLRVHYSTPIFFNGLAPLFKCFSMSKCTLT